MASLIYTGNLMTLNAGSIAEYSKTVLVWSNRGDTRSETLQETRTGTRNLYRTELRSIRYKFLVQVFGACVTPLSVACPIHDGLTDSFLLRLYHHCV